MAVADVLGPGSGGKEISLWPHFFEHQPMFIIRQDIVKTKYADSQSSALKLQRKENEIIQRRDEPAEMRIVEEQTRAQQYTSLHKAAFDGNRLALIQLLRANVNKLNEKSDDNQTALHAACINGYLEVVEVLVDSGAQLDDKDDRGFTPLSYAVRGNHQNVVEYFIRKGENVKSKDNDGWTPLHTAAWADYHDLIRCLLEGGALVDEKTKEGNTALVLTSIQNHLASARMLVEVGRADINAKDNDGCSSLHLASLLGNLEVVKYLIERQASIHPQDDAGWTPLHTAAWKGHVAILQCLLQAGADINKQIESTDARYKSSIVLAAWKGHLECVRLLKEGGANMEPEDGTGYSALNVASLGNHAAVVQYLLDQGAQVNSADADGWSSLHWATWHNNTEIIGTLLDNRANINVKNSSSQTALHIGSGFGHINCVKLLIEKGASIEEIDVDHCTPLQNAAERTEKGGDDQTPTVPPAILEVTDKNQWNALHHAVEGGHVSCVRLLHQKGSNLEAKSVSGKTPLHRAVEKPNRNFIEIVQYLLEQNVDVNITREDGWTPLHSAASKGQTEAINLLLRSGAEIDKGAADGATALHIAALHGQDKCVRLLAEYPLRPSSEEILPSREDVVQEALEQRVNMADNDGWTPLFYAVTNGHLACVKLLHEMRANLKVAVKSGKTALQRAAEKNHRDIVQYLLENGVAFNEESDRWSALHQAAHEGNEDIVKSLLERGYVTDINKRTKEGHTALALATSRGHLSCIRTLREKEADPNIPSNSGKSPLHRAASRNLPECVKYLAEHGADVKATINQGRTPLHDAAAGGFVDVIRILINHGAEVNRKTSDESTALLLATETGNKESVQLLTEKGADINQTDYNDDTLLHKAASGDKLEIVDFLTGQGLSAISRNTMGQTPLHIAAEKGSEQCIPFLIPLGSSITDGYVDLQDNIGRTALHLAVEKGYSSVVTILSDYNDCNINAQTTDGQTCLHLAVQLCYRVDREVKITQHIQQIVSREASQGEALVLYLMHRNIDTSIQDRHGKVAVQYAENTILWGLMRSSDDHVARSRGVAREKTAENRICRKVIGQEGGKMDLEQYGFHVSVPPGALDSSQEITMQLFHDPMEADLQDIAIVAFGIRATPSGLKFKHPIQVTLPHCAIIESTSEIQTVLFYRDGSSDDGMYERIPMEANDGIPRCVVKKNELELYINHFSDSVVGLENPDGKKIVCIPYLPKSMQSESSVLLRFHLLDKVTGATKDVDAEESLLGYKRFRPPEEYIVRSNTDKLTVMCHDDKAHLTVQEVSADDVFHLMDNILDFELKPNKTSDKDVELKLFQGKIKSMKLKAKYEGMDHQMRASHGVADGVLENISKKIPHDHLTSLANELDVAYTSATTILATFSNNYGMAIRNILAQWKNMTGGPPSVLKEALCKDNLGGISNLFSEMLSA